MLYRLRTGAIAILIVALVATACGGSDSPDESAEPSSPTTVADEPSDPSDDDAMAEDEPDTEPAEAPAPTAVPLEDADQITSEGEGSADPATIGDAQTGGEISWAFSSDGTGFDTTGSMAPGSIRLITSLNDSLVSLDTNADWRPNLAESLTPNDDFTSWTITMRPDLTFHDGEPVNGEAVKANFDAVRSSGTVGFALAAIDTVEVIDELSVQVDLSSPWAAFPFQLVGQVGWMVSPATIGTNETFTGTGPFMLESWTPGDSARVVRNPNYWRADEGLPYLDAINFKFLPDETVRNQAFQAGDVDGYHSPTTDNIVEFLDDDAVDVWIGTAGANEYLWLLNTTAAPFDDLRVRRAVAHAIDSQFLIDTFSAGLTTPATGPLNPSSRWYTETDYPAFDPAAAQALVDEYEAEVGPIEFELSIEPNPSVVEYAEVMLSFLTDVGIDGSIKEIGPGTSAITAIQDDYQAFSWFQFGAPDPDGNYIFFHSSGGLLNWTNLVSADIDEGLDKGRQNVDEATRAEGYAQFLQALADEVPMVWVEHLNGTEAVATTPVIHGIGTPGTLPDGGAQLPMTNGTFFAWTEVWLEQ